MARTRSYFAKANRGKEGIVFFNNAIASAQRASKNAAKARERKARADERDRNRREREREKDRQRELKESQRRQREFDRLEMQRKREEEKEAKKLAVEEKRQQAKYEKLFNYLKLHFEKKSLIFYVPEIDDIITRSRDAELTNSETIKLLVDGKEDEIKVKVILRVLIESTDESFVAQNETQKIIKIIAKKALNSVDDLVNDQDMKKLIARSKNQIEVSEFLTEAEIDLNQVPEEFKKLSNFAQTTDMTVEKLKKSKIYTQALNKIQNESEIAEFLENLRKSLKILPDNFDEVLEISQQENMTTKKIENSAIYKNAVQKKESLVSNLNEKINQYLNE